ncbi:MAG: DUF2325 domain-containing protein [Gemmataceae bacterium]|nr:DUF2325 domain-containing protein [Gemmataceae bacterium]
MTAWTSALGARLLESLPGEDLARLASAHGILKEGESAAPPRLRRELLLHAGQSVALQRGIRLAWRAAHGDVVAAAHLIHLSVAGAAAQCESLLGQFSPEEILLELLTDEHDDGWQLAREFVQELRGETLRQQCESLLAGWLAQRPRPKAARVVIFGGHPRDESRLGPLFESGPFELRWRVCERRQGDSADRGLIADALNSADAAIIITGMASHNIMELARGLAKSRGLRWRCVEKATAGQLTAALEEMFPEL